MFLEFVKWEGEKAIFKKSHIMMYIICNSFIGVLGRVINVKEVDKIIIRTPKGFKERSFFTENTK